MKTTALRETHEEINLKNTDLEILGELPFFYTGTGYKVKPIISKLNNNVFLEETLKPDLNEIEKIFIADAEELLSPVKDCCIILYHLRAVLRCEIGYLVYSLIVLTVIIVSGVPPLFESMVY